MDQSDQYKPATTSLANQAAISAMGEILGLAVSIGAVYGAERVAPAQTRNLIQRVAKTLSQSRGGSVESQLANAQKIADFTIMNMGGFVNMGTQFALHRYWQAPPERLSLGYEFGRVLTGRLVGTVTAGSALWLAESRVPHGMDRVERRMGSLLGNHPRLGELATSSLLQSAGALPGSIGAQLLYDRLTHAGQYRS